MNWTKISAIAEIVSSVAVLATLVYLAIQTREVATQTQQNTAAMIANSRQQALDAELQLFRMELDYPVTILTQPQASGDDAGRQIIADFALFRIRENQWLQLQDGQLDEATVNAYLTLLVNELRQNRRLTQTWALISAQVDQLGFDASFIAEIRRRLNQ